MGQFAIPLAILGIGIIGEWLIGSPGTKQNPNAMPQLNQSLRGSSMPVTFGTARVSAQVPWTKNWKAIKGSGGKKGGGSGGLGAAKGASQNGYIYYWDSMFNYGFVDQPSFIGRAWVGTDPVKKEDVETLNAGLGVNYAVVNSAYTSISSNVAHLQYTEAQVNPGYATGDTNLETWSYFQTQEGVSCAWPSNFWIGFRALNLGNSGQLPQLAVELVPLSGAQGLIVDTGFIGKANGTAYTGGMLRDDNGNYYAIRQPGTVLENSVLYRVDNPTVDLYTFHSATWIGQVTARIPSITTAFANFGDFIWGTPYFYICGYQIAANTTHFGMLCKIETDGSVSYHGCWAYNSSSTAPVANPSGCGMADINGYVIRMWARVSDNTTYVMSYPAPGMLGDGVYSDLSSADTMSRFFCQIPEFLVNFLGCLSYRTAYQAACFIPNDPLNNTLIVGGYRGHAEIQWSIDNPASIGRSTYLTANGATSPNGMLVTATVTPAPQIGFTSISYVFNGITSSLLVQSDGTTPVIPPSDVGLKSTGAAGTYEDDYSSIFSPFKGMLTFIRKYSDSQGLVKVVALYGKVDPITGDFTSYQQVDALSGAFYSSADVGGSNTVLLPVASVDQVNGAVNIFSWVSGGLLVAGQFGFFIGGADVTPPYIIKQILLSKVWGFQTDALFGFNPTPAQIDTTSYNDAVAYCQSESILISVSYSSTESVLDVINELVGLYNGYLTEHAGVIYFGVVRSSDTAFRTIDNSHLISDGKGNPPVTITKAALADSYNIIHFQFLDRDLDYNQNDVWVSDEVDIDFNGPRMKEYSAKFVMSGSTAQRCSERALWCNLYGKDRYQFKLGVKDADLRPGRLITLVDSFDNTLSSGVLAMVTHWSEDKRLEFNVEAVRVVTDYLDASHGYTRQFSISNGGGGMIDDVQPPLAMRAYELPYQFQQNNNFLYFGWNQNNQVKGGQLWLSLDGTTYTEDMDEQPYPTSGILADALPVRDPGYVESNIEVYLMPTSGFIASSPTYVQTTDLEDTSLTARQAGLTGMVVGSEFIACEGATLLAQNHYRVARAYRGWGGTPISAQASGAYWNHHGDGVFAHQIAIGDIGKTLYYKVLPYNWAGDVCNIASVNAQTYTIKGDYWLPRAEAPIQFFVNSAKTWSSSTPVQGQYIAMTSGGGDVTLQWPAASNNEGFGYGGAGNGGAGHFGADMLFLLTPLYRVDVMSSNGTKVSSFFTTTGYYSYTLAQNSADFHVFGKNLMFQVTPYNTRGDGYVSYTRSLSLIW